MGIHRGFFDSCDCGSELEDDDDELHHVDMDRSIVDSLNRSVGPVDVEPKLQFVTKGAASCEARVSGTCELGVARNYVTNLHFPCVGWVGHEGMEVREFVSYGWCEIDF